MFVDWLVASIGRQPGARALLINVVSAGLACAAASFGGSPTAEAKGPGRTYCFYKTCHRVKTIAETQALIGTDLQMEASHYDSCKNDRFNPCGLTSSGERFYPESADNAASPILPDGTIALVWAKQSKEAVVIRINNAGPYWGKRKLDLSRAAAAKLGIGGVGTVTLRVLKAPTAAEAKYSKNRRYQPVPGPIGQFASLDAAHIAMSIMAAERHPETTALAGLAMPADIDPAIDLASAYATPLVPGFTVPKGALAQALIAQSTIERRVVTATVPPSTDVAVLTPKIAAAKPVKLRPVRVRARDVKPQDIGPLEAVADLVTALIDPPKPAPVAKRARTPAILAKKATAKRAPEPKAIASAAKAGVAARKAAARLAVATATPRVAQRRAFVIKAEPRAEFRAGFTTYAEEYYRKPAKIASAAKLKSASKAAAKSATANPEAVQAGPVKQANAGKGRKQAALKKSGGWQSSAVLDAPISAPMLTIPHPRVPAGEMKNDMERERGPRLRVHPSALV